MPVYKLILSVISIAFSFATLNAQSPKRTKYIDHYFNKHLKMSLGAGLGYNYDVQNATCFERDAIVMGCVEKSVKHNFGLSLSSGIQVYSYKFMSLHVFGDYFRYKTSETYTTPNHVDENHVHYPRYAIDGTSTVQRIFINPALGIQIIPYVNFLISPTTHTYHFSQSTYNMLYGNTKTVDISNAFFWSHYQIWDNFRLGVNVDISKKIALQLGWINYSNTLLMHFRFTLF